MDREERSRPFRGTDWKRTAAMAVSISVLLVALWLLLKYGASVLLPFFFAWVCSLLLLPLAERIAERLRIPVRLVTFLLLLLFLSLFVLFVSVTVSRLLREIDTLLLFFAEEEEMIAEAMQGFWDSVSSFFSRFRFLAVLSGQNAEAGEWEFEAIFSDVLRELLSEIAGKIPLLIGGFIKALPSGFLFTMMFLISVFYFCFDHARIETGIARILPEQYSSRFDTMKERFTALLYRYLRIYFLIFLITFTELLVGFMVIGQPYPVLLALLISALDILPILGVGTVICPWAIVLFLCGDYHTALGLLILWGIILIVRQVIEPRLIGENFGMHPLLALVSLYAGIRLLGILGVFLGPAIAVLARLLLLEFFGRRGRETVEKQ